MGNVFIVGLFMGAGLTVYLFSLRLKAEKAKDKNLKGEVLYLNVTVINKEEALRQGVKEKVESKIGTGFVARRIQKRIAQAAISTVSDEKIATGMSEKISAVMPPTMLDLGIKATVKKVYQKNAYFVLEINLQEVDTIKLIGKKSGEEKASQLDYIVELLGGKSILDMGMLSMVASKLEEILPTRMEAKMEAKGMEVDIEVKTAAKQAQYLFDTVADDFS